MTSLPTQQVQIRHFPETRVAAFEHRGDPRRIDRSVQNFIAWRKQNRLPPSAGATFNIVYDNPETVAPTDFRLDLCAAFEGEVAANEFGVIGKVIPAGRCAVLRHIGSDAGLGDAARYLYAEWLPSSGEVLRDFLLYFQRVVFPPEVQESQAITDIFLPLR